MWSRREKWVPQAWCQWLYLWMNDPPKFLCTHIHICISDQQSQFCLAESVSPTVSPNEHCPCLLSIGNRHVLWPHGALAAGTEAMHTTPAIFLVLKPCTIASWAIGAGKSLVLLLPLASSPGKCPGIACGFESSVLVWLWGLAERLWPSGIHVHWLNSRQRCSMCGPLIVFSK